MVNMLLAVVPLVFVAGFLAWVMIMGSREQARADAWMTKWVKDNQHQGSAKH